MASDCPLLDATPAASSSAAPPDLLKYDGFTRPPASAAEPELSQPFGENANGAEERPSSIAETGRVSSPDMAADGQEAGGTADHENSELRIRENDQSALSAWVDEALEDVGFGRLRVTPSFTEVGSALQKLNIRLHGATAERRGWVREAAIRRLEKLKFPRPARVVD